MINCNDQGLSSRLTKLLEVLVLLVPELLLPEAVLLAWCATELKGGVDGIWLDLEVVLQLLHKVHVTAAEVCHRQDANKQLATVTCSTTSTTTGLFTAGCWSLDTKSCSKAAKVDAFV